MSQLRGRPAPLLPDTLRGVEVTRVTAGASEWTISTLGRAFCDDAIVRWPLRPGSDAEAVGESLRALVDVHVRLGTLWEVDHGAGVAAWLPPAEVEALDKVWADAAASVAAYTDDGGARYDRFWAWSSEHVPDEPAWILDFIGVEPAKQGRGLGSVLMSHGLQRVAADGLPVFLETATPSNVPYYQARGFRVVEEADAPDGGPHVWFMRHD